MVNLRLVLIDCDYSFGPSEIRDAYAWVGGCIKYGIPVVGVFNLVFQFGFSYIDLWCGACDIFTDGVYENECIVGGVSHTPRYDVGMFCLDYVNPWAVYDAVGACFVIQYGFKM